MRLKLKGKDSQNIKSIVLKKKKNRNRVKFQVFLQNLGEMVVQRRNKSTAKIVPCR